MDELDSSSASTTRLRRRSFFENIDSDPSAFAPPSLDSGLAGDKDSAGAPASSASGADGDSAGASSDRARSLSSSSAPSPSTQTASSAAASAGASVSGHGYRGGVAGALAQWLLSCVLTVLYRVKLWLLLQWQRLRLHELPPVRYLQSLREKSAAAAAVTHWAYPTQWLTLACVSLVLAQLVVAAHFQLAPLALHVKECVFHEQLMPALPAASSSKDAALAGSSAPAMRYLERRFEQLHSHVGPTHKNKPRLPWTCIAIVASADDRAAALELAFLLPRSRVLEPASADSVASRLQLVTGSGSGAPLAFAARGAHAGVLGARFPLRAFRHTRFASGGFPDLVLVETEFALKQLVKLRQEQQEQLQQRVQRAGDTDTTDVAHHHERARTHFGIYFTQTTVPDVFDRRVRKRWDAFLHVVVTARESSDSTAPPQVTKELLTLWLAHPEWPVLHVRFAQQQSLALCGSFARFLSSVHTDAADHHREHDVDDDNADKDKDAAEARVPANIDLACDAAANTRSAIVALKNAVGMHLFPAPPASETHERVVLESLAVGAMVVTYNTPVMQEWIPDACGLRAGTFELPPPHRRHVGTANGDKDDNGDEDDGAFALPIVHVTASEIERAVASLLTLDRVNRVANGRAARLQYLRMRTHYLSAMAALDTAVCDDDTDDAIEVPSEIGHRSRKKVEVETLRVFLY